MQEIQLKPPFTKTGKKIESMCRKAIFDFHLLDGQKKIGVALSGGKDSLTMLIMLNAINGKGFESFDLHAFCVSGSFSCGASLHQNYLKTVCKQLNIPLHIAQTNQEKQPLDCYVCARKRRKLLFEMAKNEGISTLAFGHHRDDLIQTLLMNLFHKGEFSTMLARIEMKKINMTLIRPLIYVQEELIKSFAKQMGFLRITCQCEKGQHSYRKKTDLLIQEIEELYPNIRQNLLHSALKYGSNKALID